MPTFTWSCRLWDSRKHLESFTVDSTVFVQHSPEEAGRGQLVSLVGGEAREKVSPDRERERTIRPCGKSRKPRGKRMPLLTRMALKVNILNWNNETKCQTTDPHKLSLSRELSTHVLPWVIPFLSYSFVELHCWKWICMYLWNLLIWWRLPETLPANRPKVCPLPLKITTRSRGWVSEEAEKEGEKMWGGERKESNTDGDDMTLIVGGR